MISFNLNYSPKAQSSNIVTKNIQFSSVTQSLPSLYEPKDCSTPGFPVHHQLLEFGQTHDRGVSDAIQSSHPHPFFCLQSFLASGSFPMNQFFTSGGQSFGVSASTSVLPMISQVWSLEWTGWVSLQSKGLSRVFSNNTVQKHQFFGAQLLHSPTLNIHTWPLEKP